MAVIVPSNFYIDEHHQGRSKPDSEFRVQSSAFGTDLRSYRAGFFGILQLPELSTRFPTLFKKKPLFAVQKVQKRVASSVKGCVATRFQGTALNIKIENEVGEVAEVAEVA
jgi:hypothetical protein